MVNPHNSIWTRNSNSNSNVEIRNVEMQDGAWDLKYIHLDECGEFVFVEIARLRD